MKNIILIAILCFCQSYINAQEKLKAELDSYKDLMKLKIQSFLNSKKKLTKYANKVANKNFILIPYCRLRWEDILEENDWNRQDILNAPDKLKDPSIFKLLKLVKDSLDVSYNMNYIKDSFIVSPILSSRPFFINPSVSKVDSVLDYPIFRMYQQAIKKSKYVFVLRIQDGFNPYTSQIMGFIEENKLKILALENGDGDIGQFQNLEDFFDKKLGSSMNYIDDIRSVQSIKIPVLDCKKMLRKSYFYYEKYNRDDSAGILNLFMNELDSLVTVTDSVNTVLRQQLKNNLATCVMLDTYTVQPYNIADNYHLEFMGRDIYSLLKAVLTSRQMSKYYNKCLYKRYFYRSLFTKIVDDYEDRHIEELEKGFRNGHSQYMALYKKEFELVFSDADE